MSRIPTVASVSYRSSISLTIHARASAARFGWTITGDSRCGTSAKCDSSTRLGSTSISFTSSGVVRTRMDVTNVLIRLDLPAPVAPAISRCGISARFTRTERPCTSLPRATNRDLVSSRASREDRTSPSITKSRTLFGTSTPIADFPGIGAMIRTSGVARA